ncbi:lipopolysaccharide biosynthesis protein [Pseudonocardia acidicola]|uniref:Lipopolysaccharide biosynthesis protein n=1 Tax=Pseudonocardia acidicola TaxID=2724939 RepID=A0ABX1SEV3_9PSEU|nr:lipopolysaccharide biosynthesis protein [Pseudonocardia acidicola]NMI00086.1 lipopolysaccharide biosynthesis protein [Pseudonocardia acidicola]
MVSLRARLTAPLRRVWPLLLAVVLGLGAGLAYNALTAPTYSAQAVVIVTATDTTVASSRDVSYAAVFGRIFNQPEILTPAAAAAGVDANQLRTRVQGTAATDSPSIQLTATATTADAAAAEANAVAKALIDYGNSRTADTGVRLALLGSAYPPATRSAPVLALSLGVGAAAGIVVGGLVLAADAGRRRRAAGSPGPDHRNAMPAGVLAAEGRYGPAPRPSADTVGVNGSGQ